MPRFEFEGRTPAEAAIKACEELGLTRSELRYDVVSDAGAGIERKVRIAVEAAEKGSSRPQPTPLSAPSEDRGGGDRPERSERSGGDRGGGERYESRGGGRDRGGDRGGRGGGRDRDRGGRGGGRDRDRGGRGGGRDRDRGGRDRREPVPREADDGIEALLKLDQQPETAIPPRPEVASLTPKAQQAKEVLGEILRHMSWQAAVRVVQDDGEEIHLDVTGNDQAKVIGKKGEPLLSLQFIVNRMVSHEGENEPVVVLDVGGYRERRRAALADLARRLAARAMEEKKVVKLSPMSAHDRRVFHLTLTEMQGVTTRSEGDGLYRRLLIIPSEFAQAEQPQH